MIPSSSSSRFIAQRVLANGRAVSRSGTRRCNSFTAGPSSSSSGLSVLPLMVAGMAGGAAVLLGGYGYYHFSGLGSAVESSKSVQQTLAPTKSHLAAEKTPAPAKQLVAKNTPTPNEALAYLRLIAKSYVAFIPGAAYYVDASFDTLDELHQTRREEVDAIIQQTFDDVKQVVANGQMDVITATKVLSILQRQGALLHELANEAGQDIIGPILYKHPEVKAVLGGGWEEIQRVAWDSEAASQAKRVAEDTKQRLSEIFQAGFTPEAISKAKDLIEARSKEIEQLNGRSGKDAWQKGAREYQRYIDKAPEDVKKLLSPDGDSIKTILAGGGSFSAATAIWAKVKDIGSSKDGFDQKSLKELRELVEERVKQAEDATSLSGPQSINLNSVWKNARGWLKSVPGGQKALDQVQDVDVSALSKVVQSRGEDAEKLARDTYSEILKVLTDKSEKAQELMDEANEANRRAKK